MSHRSDFPSHSRRWLRTALAALLVGGVLAVSTSALKGRAQAPIINSNISKTWKDNEMKPSDPTSDDMFIRRVFVDLLGRTPTTEEVKEYEATNPAASGRLWSSA